MSNDPYGRPGPPGDDSVAFGPGSATPPAAPATTEGTGGTGRGGTGRKIVVGGLAAAVVGGIAVAGYSFASAFLGGGPQPEDVLPANTVAFAKIDLNPSADQKVNAFRLLKKFPTVKVDEKDLKATVFEDLFDDNDYGLTYQKDVAPWLGNRVAVAAVPAAAGTHDAVTELVVVEFTDEDKMRAALARVDAALAEKQKTRTDDSKVAAADEDGFAYAVRDHYVLIGDDQAEVDNAAAAKTVLADDPTFAADKDAVDGDGKVALGWVDLGAAYDTVPEADKQDFTDAFGDSAPAGRVAAAVTVEPDYVQVGGRTRDLEVTGLNTTFASKPGTSLVRGFPADTDIAFSATGLGSALMKVWADVGTEPLFGTLDDQATNLDLHLPDDLGAVFGTEFAIGAKLDGGSGSGDGYVRANTADPDRAVQTASTLLDLSGEPDVSVAKVDGGYVAATDADLGRTVTDGSGGLGDDPVFTAAVADAEHANAIFFLNIDAVVESFGDWVGAEGRKEAAPLQAVGLSASGDGANGRFTLRVTTK